MVLWIEDHTARAIDLGIWTGEIPTPWFLALNPLLIFVLTPLIVQLWAWQATHGREPSSVHKMAFGCLCVALANLVMLTVAASAADGAKASALWLVGYFTLVTIGELFLAPVGLALISKVAPLRIRAMMMGVWFATTLPGDTLGGFLGGYWSTFDKPRFYLMIAAIAALAGAVIWALSWALRSIFGE
jgi:POT family proton-dependent oligopeptide transporter